MSFSNKKINEIYKSLKAGFTYSDGFRGIYFDGVYFRWNNYGSSAVKATKQDLKWLLENIFDDTTENTFESKYKKGNGFVYA